MTITKYNKVLVTGGCGFIGSALVKRLAAEGYHVRVMDFRGGCNPHAEFMQKDILDMQSIEEACRSVDAVIHLAALANVPDCNKDPQTAYRTNAFGTLSMLMAAEHAGVEKVIYASSAAVYGNALSKNGIYDEEIIPLPTSPYGISKYLGEEFCTAFDKYKRIYTISLRFFNVYGRGQSDHVIPNFIMNMLYENDEAVPTIFGDGTQKRDYIHIDDIVSAIIHSLRNDQMSGVYNVGSGNAVSVNELFNMIKSNTYSKKDCKHVGNRIGDAQITCADINRIIKTGWAPAVILQDGIRRMICG